MEKTVYLTLSSAVKGGEDVHEDNRGLKHEKSACGGAASKGALKLGCARPLLTTPQGYQNLDSGDFVCWKSQKVKQLLLYQIVANSRQKLLDCRRYLLVSGDNRTDH